MTKPTYSSPLLLLAALLALTAGPTLAGPSEVAVKAESAVESGVGKAESATKHGGSVASDGIQRGVKAMNHGADFVAAKLGLPKGTAADARRAQESSQHKADPHPDASMEAVAPPPAARTAAPPATAKAKSGK
jgi:hypothetical protein